MIDIETTETIHLTRREWQQVENEKHIHPKKYGVNETRLSKK